MSEELGKKFDQGKLDFSLLPFGPLEEVVKVLMFGAKKYARDNWQKVSDPVNRYKAALLRHASALMQGEIYDPESGMFHSACIATNALFLTWFLQNGTDEQKQEAGAALSDLEAEMAKQMSEYWNDAEGPTPFFPVEDHQGERDPFLKEALGPMIGEEA